MATKKTNTKKSTKPSVIIGYKGFDKDFKCRDFQFEVGKTYKTDGDISCCVNGFHACEMPLDVFSYYPPESRFAVVEQSGKTHKKNDGDTKIASANITINAEIKLPEIIKKAVAWIIKKSKSNIATGYYGHAAATGNSGHAAATGYSGHAAATGYSGHAAATGDSGHAAATGNYGCSFAGFYGKAKATNSGAIAICFFNKKKKRAEIISGNIGEHGLKPDVFYTLDDNGNFIKA